MSYDVIVIGAGPAGCAAATECARQGLSTLCIEEHGTIGYPVQCAGLLSDKAFAECRVSERPVLNRVSGARVVSGLGSEILIDAKVTKAVVADRGSLDREMAETAADSGAEFLLKTAAYGIRGNSTPDPGCERSQGNSVQASYCRGWSPEHDCPFLQYAPGKNVPFRYPGRSSPRMRSPVCGDLSRCFSRLFRMDDSDREGIVCASDSAGSRRFRSGLQCS